MIKNNDKKNLIFQGLKNKNRIINWKNKDEEIELKMK